MEMGLSSKEIENLKEWKYLVEDFSIISNWHQPFWRWGVMLFPETVHPNYLTYCSFACILLAYKLSVSQMFHYDGLSDSEVDCSFELHPGKAWTIVAIVLLNITYMHLDAMDGKQARRLMCSSPIGELLDHALDNIGMIYSLLTATNLWGVEDQYLIYTLIFVCSSGFFMSHLDAYLSKTQTFVLHY